MRASTLPLLIHRRADRAEPQQTATTPDDSAFDEVNSISNRSLTSRSMRGSCIKRFIVMIAGAALVPVDLAVGWGPMSDQAVLDQLEISQSARFFWYQYPHQAPIPREEIVSHATNLHLIPSNKALAGQCKSLRTGELIHLSGLLVEATARRLARGAAHSAGLIPVTALASWSG
jgi:hypothetical protein